MIKAHFRAKKESDIYYYADGTHPTHNTRSTYAWIKKGKRLEQQPTVSGRARVNINGLLNAYDVTDVIAHDVSECQCRFHHRPLQGSFGEAP